MNFKKISAVWRKLTTAKSSDLEEARLEYSTRVLTIVIFGVVALFAIVSLILSRAGLPKLSFAANVSLGLSAGLLTCIYLNIRDQWRTVRFVAPTLILVVALYSLLDSGMNTGGTFSFIFVVLLAQLLLETKWQLIFITITVSCITGYGVIEELLPSDKQFTSRYAIALMGIFLFWSLVQFLAIQYIRIARQLESRAVELKKEVATRVKAEKVLQTKVNELEVLNSGLVDRELRMIELKKELDKEKKK